MGRGLVWALFIPELRWVPYIIGALGGAAYVAAGVSWWCIPVAYILWRLVR